MKVIALSEIHMLDGDKKPTIATPGLVVDLPQKLVQVLLDNHQVRRLTDDEIELDKLRAQAKKSAPADEEDEDADAGDDEEDDKSFAKNANTEKGEVEVKGKTTTAGKPVTSKAISNDKPASKATAKDY